MTSTALHCIVIPENDDFFGPITMNAAFQQSCTLCDAALREAPIFSRMLGIPEDRPQRVYECRRCKYRLLLPYFDENEVRELYGEHYFTGHTDVHGQGAAGFDVDYEVWAVERGPKFRATLDLISHFAPSTRSILDVGAATGEFLAIARDRGLDSSGVELSPHAAAVAKARNGLDLFVGRLEDFQPSKKFDAIHLNHVLEHFPQPRAAIEFLVTLLSPAGVIYVEVPYQFNIVERMKFRFARSKRPFTISSIHHSSFFTPTTLTRLFALVGMRPLMLRVFDCERYPAPSAIKRAKRMAWNALSWGSQGLFIEAIFARSSGERFSA